MSIGQVCGQLKTDMHWPTGKLAFNFFSCLEVKEEGKNLLDPSSSCAIVHVYESNALFTFT